MHATAVPAWRRWAALGVAIGGVAILLLAREPVSGWLWPDTRVQQLRADAANALLAGELTRTDGRGARELYQAALALDPDRPDARDGLARVGRAALARAETAFAQGRFDDAQASLQLARDLDVPRSQAEALEHKLRERTTDAAGLDLLLATAHAARAAGRLDGAADTALPLYQRVLALQPNHISALEGREDTLADLLQRARDALRADDLVRAGTLVARVQAVDPGHFDLPAARAALAGATTRRLQQASRELDRGHLSSAVAGYRAVEQVDPGNAEAAHGLAAVAGAHAAASERHAADFRFVQAQAALLEAQAIAPDTPAVTAALAYLARARQSHARLDSGEPAAQRRQRVAALLAAASAAEARGDLLDPPGESAYDKLRAAQAIAPRDPEVQAAIGKLAPSAHACFQRNLRANALSKADACLDAWAALEASDMRIGDARRRLAARWIAYANERLGAYELGAADAALARARELDANAPGLEDLAGRLVTAGGG
ncbi:hypothetical protein [Lysobacter sp. F6437]|uniref:hypothetical protein n=1 Tax=Lysobacter sp. F6437 TaxID=3459296 RepID=UPI00403DB348